MLHREVLCDSFIGSRQRNSVITNHSRRLSTEDLMLKTLESPWDCKIKPVHVKGNQPWIFTGSADSEAPIRWVSKSGLTGKDPDAGKDWRQEQNGATEDERVGWHYRLSGQEFEQTLGDSGGQRNLACCSPWGRKSWTRLSDWTTTTKEVTAETSVNRPFPQLIMELGYLFSINVKGKAVFSNEFRNGITSTPVLCTGCSMEFRLRKKVSCGSGSSMFLSQALASFLF